MLFLFVFILILSAIVRIYNKVVKNRSTYENYPFHHLISYFTNKNCSVRIFNPEHVEDHIKSLIAERYQLYVINLGSTVNSNTLKAYVISGIFLKY